jgi:hypothetical protein
MKTKTSSKSATFVQHIIRPGTGPIGCARALCDKKLVVKIAKFGEDFVECPMCEAKCSKKDK